MTKKRYRKLVYATMQNINKDSINRTGLPALKVGRALKGCLGLEYKNMNHSVVHSYKEAWELVNSTLNP